MVKSINSSDKTSVVTSLGSDQTCDNSGTPPVEIKFADIGTLK